MPDHLPRQHQIDAFRAVMSRRSVTEAALMLRVSQPAVSKSIRQLEELLGVKLFERVSGRLMPTAEAEAMAPAIDGVAASLRAVVAAGRAMRDSAGGQISVATVPSLSTVVLPRAIAAAAKRLPGLRVSTQVLDARQAVEVVARGNADIALVHDIVEDPLVQVEELGHAAMACAVPVEHRLAHRKRIRPADLQDLPFASYDIGSPVGQRLTIAFEAEGTAFVPTFELGAAPVVCEVARQTGIPAIVENYILALGWWPDMRVVPLVPEVSLRVRLLTTLQRPVPRSAKVLGQAFREVVTRLVS
jgi:DNA-binding transcriptional LysR family regulator